MASYSITGQKFANIITSEYQAVIKTLTVSLRKNVYYVYRAAIVTRQLVSVDRGSVFLFYCFSSHRQKLFNEFIVRDSRYLELFLVDGSIIR